jgi:hypothetical protein
MSTRYPARLAAAALSVAVAGILVLATAAPAGYDFQSGYYSGTTSQKDEVGDPHSLLMQVVRSKKKVRIGFFEIDAPPCGGGGMGDHQFGTGETVTIRRNGSFNYINRFGYGSIKGNFDGRKAKGTLRYHFDQLGCDTGRVTWRARKTG